MADIIANLSGISLIGGDWQRDPPFYLHNDGSIDETLSYLVFTNGMVSNDNLIHGDEPRLMPHDPQWFNPIVLPLAYDPLAICPRWRRFLTEVLPRSGDGDRRQEVLQAAVGYCLLLDCRFEAMFILVGNGKNGKSVFLKTLTKLLDDENVSHVAFEQLGGEFRLTSLVGKLANITMELNHLTRANEALIRSLVSGERLTINRKFLSPIETRSFAKLFVATNDLPAFADATNATWRRLKIINFDVTISSEQVNRGLADELAGELPGIFNWAVAGLRRLLVENGFPNCERSAAAVAQLRWESDSVREFLHECCAEAEGWESPTRLLYEFYRCWCESCGRKPYGATEFGKRLKRAGHQSVRASVLLDPSRSRVYRGLRIRPDAEWVLKKLQAKGSGDWRQFPYTRTPQGPACPGMSGQPNAPLDTTSPGESIT